MQSVLAGLVNTFREILRIFYLNYYFYLIVFLFLTHGNVYFNKPVVRPIGPHYPLEYTHHVHVPGTSLHTPEVFKYVLGAC